MFHETGQSVNSVSDGVFKPEKFYRDSDFEQKIRDAKLLQFLVSYYQMTSVVSEIIFHEMKIFES